MSEEEIKALDQPRQKQRNKKKWLDEYANIIYKMTCDGYPPEVIYSYLIKKGYTGTEKSLSNLIERILMNNFGIKLAIGWYNTYKISDSITVIKRSDIIKYISSKDETEDDSIDKVKRNISVLKEKYPVIKELDEIYNVFHHILMGNDTDELDLFVEYYKKSSIQGFIDGLKKDILPAKNAISFPQSSGFVEGNNNKFKVLKRILYGRANLCNLFFKCMPAFMMFKQDYNLKKALLSSKAYTHY